MRWGVASKTRWARQRLEQRPDLLAAGTSSVLWAILDEVVEDYAPVVPDSNATSTTSRPPCSPAPSRPPNGSTRCAARLLCSTARSIRWSPSSIWSSAPAVATELRPYLRDVYNHLLFVEEEVADQRDLLQTVLDANMAVISVEQTKVGVRQNSTIEQLTVLATIFLPLTFLTGFFGQNFEWMVTHVASLAAFLIFGIGGLAVALALLLSWLRVHRSKTDTSAAAGEAAG